jgi:hypothetical protein
MEELSECWAEWIGVTGLIETRGEGEFTKSDCILCEWRVSPSFTWDFLMVVIAAWLTAFSVTTREIC